MKSTTKQPCEQQSASDRPRFDWRAAVVRARPSTRAGSFVAHRFRIDPAIADLIASLAGLGQEVS
jgi:hypothetical protein